MMMNAISFMQDCVIIAKFESKKFDCYFSLKIWKFASTVLDQSRSIIWMVQVANQHSFPVNSIFHEKLDGDVMIEKTDPEHLLTINKLLIWICSLQSWDFCLQNFYWATVFSLQKWCLQKHVSKKNQQLEIVNLMISNLNIEIHLATYLRFTIININMMILFSVFALPHRLPLLLLLMWIKVHSGWLKICLQTVNPTQYYTLLLLLLSLLLYMKLFYFSLLFFNLQTEITFLSIFFIFIPFHFLYHFSSLLNLTKSEWSWGSVPSD